MKKFTPDFTHVKFLGRTRMAGDTLWLSYSATGAEFRFFGTCAAVSFAVSDDSAALGPDCLPRVAVSVNGERVVDTMLDGSQTRFPILCAQQPQEWTVQILKLSETEQSTCAIASIEADGEPRPTVRLSRAIEFIGDSITCGYGVDADVTQGFSTRTEDCTKAYAYRTAQALSAECTLVSKSGHGVISGYTSDGTIQSWGLIQDYYPLFGSCVHPYRGALAASFPWDFLAEPDLIVLNLGTNDFSYTGADPQRRQAYRENYTAFLKQVRSFNPHAPMVCTLGIMGDELYPDIVQAAEDYQAQTGDTKVTVFHFPPHTADDGYGADFHPSPYTQQRAADLLAPFLKEYMHW